MGNQSFVFFLECMSDLAEGYVRCLNKLTKNLDNLSTHTKVAALLKICAGVDSKKELIGLACGVLRNLVGI